MRKARDVNMAKPCSHMCSKAYLIIFNLVFLVSRKNVSLCFGFPSFNSSAIESSYACSGVVDLRFISCFCPPSRVLFLNAIYIKDTLKDWRLNRRLFRPEFSLIVTSAGVEQMFMLE